MFNAPLIRPTLLMTVLAVSSTLACAQAESPMSTTDSAASSTAKTSADGRFVKMAALGGMTEVKLGELASSKAESEAAKDFGKQMVSDHGKANDELAGIAKEKSLTPPDTLDAEHQKLVDKFTAMKDASFDKAYWNQMLSDHKKTIALFEREAASGKDADIKSFAARTLPTLKMHLKMVQDAMSGKAAKMS